MQRGISHHQSQKKDAKKNIRMFSGFPDTSADEAAKKTDWLDKKVTHQLKFIAEVLDVQCSGSKVCPSSTRACCVRRGGCGVPSTRLCRRAA